jgi:protein-S-isoprenylcysteine O-methyltransferase Ste14
MPPAWLPLAALVLIVAASALRILAVERAHKVKAFGFGRHAPIQGIAERTWKLAVLAAFVLALIAWLAPQWEVMLGRPEWAGGRELRWVAAILFAASTALTIAAQIQMGASWRVGVPKEGPGDLVTRGLFAWSRNPIFVGMLGAAVALFLWSPHIATAGLLAAIWTLIQIQVRIEEEALREKHGDAYERYAAQTGRWFGRRRMAVR